MSEEKKVLLPEIKAYKASGDLSKKWFVYYYEGTKRIRVYGNVNQYKTVKSREAALQKLMADTRAQLRRKVTRAEAAVMDWIEARRLQWSFFTYQEYKSVARLFFEFVGGRELTQDIVVAFFDQARQTKKAATFNKYRSYLKKFLDNTGFSFSFDRIEKAKGESTPARYFQRHQARQLLSEIDQYDGELALFIRFIYYCFIRPKELRLLRVGDVLLEEEQIRIPGAISKNNKTQFVVIPSAFLPVLNDLYARPPGALIFPGHRDPSKPLGKNTMNTRHRDFLKKLGFGTGYSIYSWKHTGAVAAAKAGISIKELQLQLRHHSLDETDKYLRQMGVKDLSRLQADFPEI
jgi:integrase